MLQLVMVMKVMIKRGKAGEARGSAPPGAMTSLMGGVERPSSSSRKNGTSRHQSEVEFFLYHNFETDPCGLPLA